ncbi:agmatine deiminase family protein [Synoicihabitans lomoniglobus]|uniref:Agmatine deiminase family protein n=1 Tax=Synoicihabitans lomoniglobus TaxID=2909285 RepID=A0AAF0I454_9BACT|nr:agmatine deiminase family protein [Opitutaceae bacterium LMO-M01]WED66658.1 agmatine deiminase family protein [Opitutaceae bacterium LMO-M01]
MVAATPRRSSEIATPAALGFRMPAEWEPQEAVWLSWPHKRASWPGLFRNIPATFAGYVAAISRFEKVRINCAAALQPRALKLCTKAGADMAQVEFYDHPTNDAWCRDHGPIFVKQRQTGEVALTDWMHNAWGGKYPPYDLDNEIPPSISRALKLRRFEKSMVLEGGSIDVNGKGLLLTTEQCLLHPNRNPDLTRADIERALKDYLGVRRILWLGEGIVGDDTDGHIDDISRFFRADGIITCVEKNRRSPNHKLLAANLERMRDFRTMQGKPIEVVELPMPRPVVIKGEQVPASYANFLIVNDAVLAPTFRQPRRDVEACGIIGGCFPGREIVPIDCAELIWGLGTLHCLSQQQPA